MKTRIIHTKIWEDQWFRSLNRASSRLFIYLLTNSRVGLIDTYEIADDVICFGCKINPKELGESKEELKGKVVFYNGWVKIINCEKYQTFKGEKNEIAKEKEEKLIPSNVKEKLYTLSIPYRYPSDTTSNHKSIISNKKLVISNKYKSIKDVGEQDFKEISEKYKVPIPFVRSKYDDLCNWVGEKPSRGSGRNFRLTLAAWVKKDMLKIKERGNYAGRTRGIDATDL